MTLKCIPINDINCADSLRNDLGDRDGSLGRLMESIKHGGLIHPLTLTADLRLISGRRRLEACKRLGYEAVPAYMIDLNNVLNGQADANVLHKQLTLVERARLAMAIFAEVGSRQGLRTSASEEGEHRIQSGVLTVEYAAQKAGFGSRKTFERARRVLENGCQALVQALDEGKIAVSAAAALATQPQAEQEHTLRSGKQALKAFLASHRAPNAVSELGPITQELDAVVKSLRNRSRPNAAALTTCTEALHRLTAQLEVLALGKATAERYPPAAVRSAAVQPAWPLTHGHCVQVPGTDLVLRRWVGTERPTALVPDLDPCYLFSAPVVADLQQAIHHRQNVMLIGPPGDGKTTVIEQVAAVVGAPLIKVEGHADTRMFHLLGMDILEHGSVVFKQGPLALAFEKGYWFLFDEITAVSPGVLHGIHGILNGDECLRLENDHVVHRAESFRFFATSNTVGAAAARLHRSGGNRRQADATLSRFPIKIIPTSLGSEAIIELLARWSPGQYAGLPSDAAQRLTAWFLEVRKAALNTYSEVQYPITLRELHAIWQMWQTPVETTSTPRPRSLFAAVRSTILNALERPEEQRLVIELLCTYFDLNDDPDMGAYLQELEELTHDDD